MKTKIIEYSTKYEYNKIGNKLIRKYNKKFPHYKKGSYQEGIIIDIYDFYNFIYNIEVNNENLDILKIDVLYIDKFRFNTILNFIKSYCKNLNIKKLIVMKKVVI